MTHLFVTHLLMPYLLMPYFRGFTPGSGLLVYNIPAATRLQFKSFWSQQTHSAFVTFAPLPRFPARFPSPFPAFPAPPGPGQAGFASRRLNPF